MTINDEDLTLRCEFNRDIRSRILDNHRILPFIMMVWLYCSYIHVLPCEELKIMIPEISLSRRRFAFCEMKKARCMGLQFAADREIMAKNTFLYRISIITPQRRRYQII